MSDQEFVGYLLSNSTPFTREVLVPGVRVAVFYDSPDERTPRSLAGGALVCEGSAMYVQYETPLPPGVSGMIYGGGIGTLDMGKITPIVEWSALSRNKLHLGGCAGRNPVVSGPSPEQYVISGGRVVRGRYDSPTGFTDTASVARDWPHLPGGAKCEIAYSGRDYFVEAKMRSGREFRIIDAPALDDALKGFEKRDDVTSNCFRFAQHDFVMFAGYNTEGLIYRIDQGALTLIGGAALEGGDPNHILLSYDGDWPRRWFNEEEAPK